MATYTELPIEDRNMTGGSAARAIRREGKIPAVFYFHGEENKNLILDRKKFYRAIHSGSHIFEATLNGKKRHVMIKSVQYHPVTEDIIHVDLQGVRMSEKIGISIPIILKGEAEGVKEGGVLMQNLTALDIQCLPTDVPENAVLDITELEINNNLTVADISLGDEIEIVTNEETTVVTIQPPITEVEPELPEEELEEGEEVDEAEEGEAPEGEEVPEGEKEKESTDGSKEESEES